MPILFMIQKERAAARSKVVALPRRNHEPLTEEKSRPCSSNLFPLPLSPQPEKKKPGIAKSLVTIIIIKIDPYYERLLDRVARLMDPRK